MSWYFSERVLPDALLFSLHLRISSARVLINSGGTLVLNVPMKAGKELCEREEVRDEKLEWIVKEKGRENYIYER